jgi:leader peptidase (prepilin peptidase)/N-methyltransferase
MANFPFPVVLLLGLLAGALVNYLADVLPRTRRLSRPLWMLPEGERPLGAYLIQPRVLAVHVFFLLAAWFLWRVPPFAFTGWQLFLLLVYFGVVIVIDLEHKLIMHPVSVAGAVFMAGMGVLWRGWGSTLLGGVVGFVLMLSFYWLGDVIGRWLARRRGQAWEETALGFGDVNLAGVVGLLLGFPAVLAGLFTAVMLGGVVSMIYILVMLALRRYQLFAAIPYGPFIALGALILVFRVAYFPA